MVFHLNIFVITSIVLLGFTGPFCCSSGSAYAGDGLTNAFRSISDERNNLETVIPLEGSSMAVRLIRRRRGVFAAAASDFLRKPEDHPETSFEPLERSSVLEYLLPSPSSGTDQKCDDETVESSTDSGQRSRCSRRSIPDMNSEPPSPGGSSEEQQNADSLDGTFWQEQMVDCAAHDSCTAYASSAIRSNSWQQSRNCLCEKDCEEYGNCCQDYPSSRDVNDTARRRKWSCTPVSDSNGYYMIALCPSDFQNEHVRTQCESSSYRKDDRFLQTPVSSWSTELTYRNLYCAVCNGDFNSSFWSVQLHCSGNKDMLLNVEQHSDISQCGVSFTMPRFLRFSSNASVIKELPLVRCDIDAVTECSDEWKEKQNFDYALEVEGKCSLIYAPVSKMSFFGLTKYKNKFCAECNGVTGDELLCPASSSFPVDAPTGKNALSLLLDMDFTRGGAIVGSQDRCPHMRVYDPWRKECRSVMCAPYHVYDQGRCVPILGDGRAVSGSDVEANESFPSTCARVSFIEEEVNILSNGTLVILGDGTSLDPGQYEHAQNDTIIVCLPPDSNSYVNTFTAAQGWLTVVGICISVAALVMKIVLGLVSKERKKVPSKIVLFLSLSLATAQLLFVFGISRTDYPDLCKLIGIVMHYCFLSSFFWTNVLAFDIWKTFSSNMPVAKNKLAVKHLLWYSVYGWGAPLVVVTSSVLTDRLVPYPHLKHLSPRYGVAVCWISNKVALTIFFGIPLAVLLLTNTVFFITTAVEIRKTTKTAKSALENTRRKDCVQFGLYCKLAGIMGLTWIFGFVAAFTGSTALWYVFIAFNSIQGVYILVAFTHFHVPDWITPGKVIKKARYSSSSRSSVTITTSVPKF